MCWGGFTRLPRGELSPWSRGSDPSGEGSSVSSQGLGRVTGSEVWAVRSLEGHNNQESIGHSARGNSGQCERTRGGKKASKQVKLAVGTILPLVTQDDREAGLRAREKGIHSSLGIRATAPKAWESVKLRVIRSPVVRSEALWITAREPVAPRGVHDLREGKALKEGSPGTVAA
jgi:hypothetical protein